MAQGNSTENKLRDALRHLADGKPHHAEKILAGFGTPETLSTRVAYLHLCRALGRPREDDEAKLDQDLAGPQTEWAAAYDRAMALSMLDRPDAMEAAKSAVALAGSRRDPTLLLLKLHLDADQPIAAADAILDATSHHDRPGGVLLAAAKILGEVGQREQAIRLLEAAKPHHQDDPAEFEFVAAGVRGIAPSSTDQSKMATVIFDKFAHDYDNVLEAIGYSAPDMIGQVLKDLPITRMRRLQALDAGCGTGLCGRFLRPYSKYLHGIDISAPMLKKAQDRKLYNELTRSDLNVPATIPTGPFDLITMADVLIYFGDVGPILGHLAQRLNPGGWVILTVEDGGDLPTPGFRLGASGRYIHSEGAVAKALAKAGLGRPKHVIRQALRHEFGKPVAGLAVAAQKPALAF